MFKTDGTIDAGTTIVLAYHVASMVYHHIQVKRKLQLKKYKKDQLLAMLMYSVKHRHVND